MRAVVVRRRIDAMHRAFVRIRGIVTPVRQRQRMTQLVIQDADVIAIAHAA